MDLVSILIKANAYTINHLFRIVLDLILAKRILKFVHCPKWKTLQYLLKLVIVKSLSKIANNVFKIHRKKLNVFYVKMVILLQYKQDNVMNAQLKMQKIV